VSVGWQWRNAKGTYSHISDALECRFPEALKKDPILQAAFAQIKIGEIAIEGRMEQLIAEAPDDADKLSFD
jgi:hypothetical protein